MSNVELSVLPDPDLRPFEIVERKGIGHPDTVSDALAERLSVALSRFYVARFGFVLHHNVDKVLLWGGTSRPRFGGGEVTAPIEIFLAGRATLQYRGVVVPVEELAVEGSRTWLRETFRFLDPEKHVRIHCLIRPGSADLVDLFARQERSGIWLANDSSIGVGYAPLSGLESDLLAVDRLLRDGAFRTAHPAFGEDTKLLGVRQGTARTLTVACAFCDRHVGDVEDYLRQKDELRQAVSALVPGVPVTVNAADDPANGSIYLTVTGTSAESGDDGQAGRGNRANGLITPGRPMTMESVAGKNPVSHVGKVYNVAARMIAEAIVRAVPQVAAAECYLASRIGQPVSRPQIAHVRLATHDGSPPDRLGSAVAAIVDDHLSRLDTLWRSLLDGAIALY